MAKVITISREYGSAGRELSQTLAKKLGVKLYDRQVISKAAAELGVEDMDIEQLKKFEEELPPVPLQFTPFYLFGKEIPESLNDKLFAAESKVIEKLAEESCVILVRAADYVLRGREHVYSFYICAEDAFRQKRGETIYEGKTLEEIQAEDAKRAAYYEHYTHRTWGDPKNYHLAINMSHLTLEEAADLIAGYVGRK